MRCAYILLVLVVLTPVLPKDALAWSPCVQGIISLAAVENLTPGERAEFFNLLRRHPEYNEMIAPMDGSDPGLWEQVVTIRAGTWADRIRGSKYDRPNWHFYPGLWGKSLQPKAPQPQFRLPADATANSRDLNLLQALELCRKTLTSRSSPDSDRAIAMCWVMNLVGKQNQPLRLFSLQVMPLFADGDDHGREILIGGSTVFGRVESFYRCGDDVVDVLAMKEKLEQDGGWKTYSQSVLNNPELATNAELQLAKIESHVESIYMSVESRVTLAILKGESAPLELSENTRDKRHFQWIGESYVPSWAGQAAGQLQVVLAESL